MNAPETVALKNAGDTLTLTVSSCEPAKVGKYPEVEFIGSDGRRLCKVVMPKSSADRQLSRADLTYQSAVGKALTFSRDPNPVDVSKPFWGIAVSSSAPAPRENGAGKQPVSLGGPIPGMDDEPPPDDVEQDEPAHSPAADKLRAIFKLHGVCFAHALKLAAVAKESGVPITLEGVSALTAQAFIAAGQHGV